MTCKGPIAACCLVIAACSPAAPDASNVQVSRAPVTAPATPAAPVAPAVPAAKPAGCSDNIRLMLDERSFFDLGEKPYPPSRLSLFKTRVSAAFRRAANDDCKTALVRNALAPIHNLYVQSGAGAAESTFYHEEGRKPDDLVFQWAFNEADLRLPEQEDIKLGLRCWADRARPECADMGD